MIKVTPNEKKLVSFCLCFAIGLLSCKNHSLQKQMEEFARKEVVVPNGIKQILAGRDTVVLDTAANVARLIVWTDSIACSTCSLDKLFEYAEIIDFHEVAKEDIFPIFVFSPPRAKVLELLWALETLPLDYPILIDEDQAFPAANPHIPTDSRFHTFLLDKNGKVVLVGDPVNNPPLWELYKTTITTLIENGGTMPESETKK